MTKKTKVLITVHCLSMSGRLRLVEDHGFEAVPDQVEYVKKVAEATFEGSYIYAETLRGVHGVVDVKIDHTIPQDIDNVSG